MASTLTKLLVHITFSTKGRAPLIPEAIESDLYAYIGGICRRLDSVLLAKGGTSDHVHLLVNMSKAHTLAELMLNIKRDSSKWLKDHDGDFAWQDGYFAFSIGESGVEGLTAYFDHQKEHHARIDFKDEMRAFFRKYSIECDERYVWD
jgi:REP element-mobilizing transposase RayT